MKRYLAVLVCLLGFAGFGMCAEQQCYDPLERNLIFVEGSAEEVVSVNCFELKFDFDVNREAFEDSVKESESIVNQIDKKVKELKLSDVEIIKGWDFIKQSKISIGDKGRKVSNMVTIRVKNFQAGKLHESIAKVVDTALGVNKDISFNEVKAFLSEDIEKAKKLELKNKAVENLKTNAEKTAQSLGKRAIAPKRVYADESELARHDVAMFQESMSMPRMMSKQMISIQKGFNVDAQVPDRVKITVNVSGIYQID